MTFERTRDYDLIRRIMAHPRVYPHITDDGCPPVEEFHPIENPDVWYVLVRSDSGPRSLGFSDAIGMWVFVPQNHICWEVHTCLLPVAYGELGAAAAKQMATWVFTNTRCRRIVTNVPECNRLALRFAKRAGMVEFGRNEKSFLKGGVLFDQIMLGLTKEEVKECPQQH